MKDDRGGTSALLTNSGSYHSVKENLLPKTTHTTVEHISDRVCVRERNAQL